MQRPVADFYELPLDRFDDLRATATRARTKVGANREPRVLSGLRRPVPERPNTPGPMVKERMLCEVLRGAATSIGEDRVLLIHMY